jgi:hypothetical protein
MRILSLPSASSASLRFLTGPPTVQAILRHLDLPRRPPPLAPARAPLRSNSPSTRPETSIPPSPTPLRTVPAFSISRFATSSGTDPAPSDSRAGRFIPWSPPPTQAFGRPVLPSNLLAPRAPARSSDPPPYLSPASRLSFRDAPSYLAFPGRRAFQAPVRPDCRAPDGRRGDPVPGVRLLRGGGLEGRTPKSGRSGRPGTSGSSSSPCPRVVSTVRPRLRFFLLESCERRPARRGTHSGVAPVTGLAEPFDSGRKAGGTNRPRCDV